MEPVERKEALISILICSRDRRHDLERLIGILKSMVTKHPFEIIAVEETDKPDPIPGIKYISHPIANRGIPYARNLALANATGEIIVFLDDDCRIHNGWLDKLLEPFKDGSVVGAQGGVTVPESTNSIGWAESMLGFPGGGIRRVWLAKGRSQETREISTLNCAYRRWVLDKVGGFDEWLKLGSEDYLLAKQACNHGRCLFVPGAMVSHESRGNLIKIWHWFVRRGRAEIRVIQAAKLEDADFWSVLRGSLTMKLCILILMGIIFSGCFIFWIVFCILAYILFQYARYHKAWRFSRAPSMALALLPVVKLSMDIAMDWGRFRGLIFD